MKRWRWLKGVGLGFLGYMLLLAFIGGLGSLHVLSRGAIEKAFGGLLASVGVGFWIWTVYCFILWTKAQRARPGEGYSDVRAVVAKNKLELAPITAAKYFKNGSAFVGMTMTEKGSHPVYIPWDLFQATHTQILGSTGFGKGVVSQLLAAQAMRYGHAVFFFDPKSDSKAPGAIARSAEEAGLPFRFIDLNPDTPLK